MEQGLKDKLKSLMVDIPVKKKRCTSCKKKKEPVKLPELIEEEIFIPTPQEILLAYIELGNRVLDKREYINKIYNFLFNEDFNFNCPSCVNGQSRRLKNYIIEVLKIEL